MKGRLLILISWALLKPVLSQTLLPDSLSRFSEKPLDTAYVTELNRLATNYLKSSPAASRKIATHNSEIATQINYTQGYARALTVIGNSYWYEGAYDLAQNFYLLAARQYLMVNDSIGMGQAYNNVGEVYKRLGDNRKALEFLLASVQLKKRDTLTQAITLYNIGELYYRTGDIPRAVEYFDQSLALSVQSNDKRVIAYSYWGFALVRYKQKNYAGSLDYFIQAEKILKEIGETRLLIQMYQDFAEVYRALKQYDKAEKMLSLSFDLSSQIKVPDLMVAYHLKKSSLDSSRGDYIQSLQHLNRYITLKDSVYNLQKSEQIARLQLIYETESRERENQQLRAERNFQEAQVKIQRQIIIGISIGLMLAAVMSWLLYRQRKKIQSVNTILHEKNQEINTQKLAIEIQATALIKLNEELQELNKHLEHRIQERTVQLSHQNQKLTEYTFINAHKLRAPVSSILGLINLLEQSESDERGIILHHLKTCGQQLDTITRQISRNLEAGIIEQD